MLLLRYPGIQPFQKEQSAIFFGRDEELNFLLDKIRIEPVLTLYGKSGMGKSSLLNAGIVPALESAGRFLPISVRFGAFGNMVHGQTPLEKLKEKFQTDGPVDSLDKIIPKENSLWYILKKHQIKNSATKPILLVFDQFEELFTYSIEDINEFKKELSEVLHVAIPPRYRKIIEEKFHRCPDFLDAQEMEKLYQPLKLKLLFSIRSDKLSLMNRLKDHFPEILTKSYELLSLSIRNAEDAILNPAYLSTQGFISPIFDYSDEAIEAILDFLTKHNTQPIESFQLQILCQTIERKVIEKGLEVVEIEEVGNMEEIYQNYYENQIASLPVEEQSAARVLLEEGLIFEEEERRLSLYEGQIQKTYNIKQDLLARLVEARLIRPEPSQQGGFIYEISHDTIVSSILKAKIKRMEAVRREQEEKKLQLQKLEIENLKIKAAEERRKRLRARLFAVAGLSLAAISIVAGLLAFQKNAELDLERLKVIEEKKKVEESYQKMQDLQKEKVEATFKQFVAYGDVETEKGNFEDGVQQYVAALNFADGFKDNVQLDTISVINKIKNVSEKQKTAQQFATLIQEGDALANKGDAQLRKALVKYEQAKKIGYDNAFTNNKIKSVSLVMEEKFNDYVEKGRAFFNANEFGLALKNFEIAHTLKPNDGYVKTQINECKNRIK